MARLAFRLKGSCIMSFTHSNGSANSCGIQAICLRIRSMLFLSDTMSLTVMRPSFNGVNPSMALRRDVFPHPDEPEMLAISPPLQLQVEVGE